MHHKPAHDAGANAASFFSLVNHPVKFRLYLLKKLPAAFFSGLKVVQANEQVCSVSVRYRWFTQNPFRSTYFASLSMAAEMSTGLLAVATTYNQRPGVSMLITGIEGRFHKKATGLTVFTCVDGNMIGNAVLSALKTGAATEVKAHTVGKDKMGQTVAEFWFSWSFKSRKV